METIIPPQPRHHPQEARFVPPLVNFSANYASLQMSNNNNNNNHQNNNNNLNNELNNNSSNNSNSNTSDMDYGSDYDTDDSSSQSRSSMQWNAFCDKSNTSANLSSQVSDTNNNAYNRTAKPKTRGRSGRKPMRNEKLTPEEEKKRQQRRERNKQAAARCRKRRMDHTNQLLMETDGLEDKKNSLMAEIDALRKQTEELEYILEAHKANCKMNGHHRSYDVKPVVSNGNVLANSSKPRPNSLPLSCIYGDNMSDTGITIQTPSTGLILEAFGSGTGLTPILNATMTPSLVTPTVTSSSCGVRLKASPALDSPKKLVPL